MEAVPALLSSSSPLHPPHTDLQLLLERQTGYSLAPGTGGNIANTRESTHINYSQPADFPHNGILNLEEQTRLKINVRR